MDHIFSLFEIELFPIRFTVVITSDFPLGGRHRKLRKSMKLKGFTDSVLKTF